MTAARTLLTRYGLAPKKSWGQNFLTDRNVIERIAEASGATKEDTVVEIGAGLGALTSALASRAGCVWAIEHDPDLVSVLRKEIEQRPELANVVVFAEDALVYDYGRAAASAGKPVIVMGNLPYQITSPLLFSIIQGASGGTTIARSVVMVQKEFAERTVASPGSKTYGRLSVMVQQFAEVKILFDVSPAAFIPQPRVRSSVMSLAPRPRPLAAIDDPERFADVVRAAFGTRRKMLKNALENGFARAAVGAALEASGIEGSRRAETLSVAEFAALTNQLAPVAERPRSLLE